MRSQQDKKRTGWASGLDSPISEAALNSFIDALQDGVGFDDHCKRIVTAMNVTESLDELGKLFVHHSIDQQQGFMAIKGSFNQVPSFAT